MRTNAPRSGSRAVDSATVIKSTIFAVLAPAPADASHLHLAFVTTAKDVSRRTSTVDVKKVSLPSRSRCYLLSHPQDAPYTSGIRE